MATIFNRDIELARDINCGLEFLQRCETLRNRCEASDEVIRGLGNLHQDVKPIESRRQLTVHRYRPRAEMGGLLGILNFDASNIEELIDRGYQDAVTHDCEECECVIPGCNVREEKPTTSVASVLESFNQGTICDQR